MSSERVLITGGAGYIGSHAVLAFLDAGYEVSVLDDLSNVERNLLPACVECHVGDLRDPVFLKKTFDAVSPAGVLHFAGAVVVPESLERPLRYYSRNSYATLRLLGEMHRRSIDKLVFSSTAAVYGVPSSGEVCEESTLAPINPYGQSKLFSEKIILDAQVASPSHKPLRTAILRYFNVAGADALLRTGQQGKNTTHLVKRIVRTLTGQQPHLDIFGTDLATKDGSCVRDYIYVSDLVDLHLQAYRRLEASPTQLLFNCGYGQGTSVLSMVACAERVSGRSVPVVARPPRAGDPVMLVADNHRLKSLFPDWKPVENPLQTIISSALAWEEQSLVRKQNATATVAASAPAQSQSAQSQEALAK